MREKDVVGGEDRREVRIIRKVVFTYRVEGDPSDAERTWTLEHDAGGEVVDGIIWSAELMRKLAYLEQEECTVPEKRPGRAGWKTYAGKPESPNQQRPTQPGPGPAERQAATDSDDKCIWLHDVNCWWSEYCTESPT